MELRQWEIVVDSLMEPYRGGELRLYKMAMLSGIVAFLFSVFPDARSKEKQIRWQVKTSI